jgi:HlyD family secretion protein
MMPKRAFAIFALLTVIVLSISACSENQASRRPTPSPVPTLVKYEPAIFTVERGNLISQKIISGEIVPSRQKMLYFRTSGIASRLVVKSGDYVKKGDLLSELQVDDVLNQLQQARIDMGVAQAALEKARVDREYAAQKAQIDVSIARARVELAYLEVTNTANADTDAEILAHDRASLNLQIANQNYNAAVLNQKQIGDATSVKEEQAVERQKLVVTRLESLLSDRQITAPYDGVILRVTFQEGKQVTAFNPAIEIGDPSELVIRSQPDSKLEPVMDRDTQVWMSFSSQAGQNYQIKFLPDFVPFSALEADAQQVFTQDWMYFSVPGELSKDKLELGATVELTVIIGHRENVLLLPPAAIRNYRGLSFVIVQDGERRRRVEISKVGLQTDQRWEIEADLQPGDKIIGQ